MASSTIPPKRSLVSGRLLIGAVIIILAGLSLAIWLLTSCVEERTSIRSPVSEAEKTEANFKAAGWEEDTDRPRSIFDNALSEDVVVIHFKRCKP